jgi:hypothetical protein
MMNFRQASGLQSLLTFKLAPPAALKRQPCAALRAR